MIRHIGVMAIFVLFAGLSSSAYAAIIQWSLENVSEIGDPALTVTGYLDYDTTIGTYPTYNISVSGAPPGAFTLTPLNSSILKSGATYFDVANSAVPFTEEVYLVTKDSLGGTQGSDLPLFVTSTVLTTVPFELASPLSGSLEASPTPLPAALPLFVTAFATLGFVTWRRKRRGA